MLRSLVNKIRVTFYNPSQYINYLRSLGVQIGTNCEIQKDVLFGSEPYLIKLGNHVRVTSGVKFITHDGGVWVLRELYKDNKIDLFGQIIVGNNVHIGMNSIIMPGVTIGSNAIIGCGAVVTKDIPDNQVWGGVPARYIKDISDYYEKHHNDFDYTKLLNQYEKKEYLQKKYDLNR